MSDDDRVEIEMTKDYPDYKKGDRLVVDALRAERWKAMGIARIVKKQKPAMTAAPKKSGE